MKKIKYLVLTIGLLALNGTNVNASMLKTTEIENSTYIIGTSMFTRDGSKYYNGQLSTDVIMLASKTIESNKLEDMIIYYKSRKGEWTDVLKNEIVEMPETIKIEYKDNEVYVEKPILSTINSDTEQGYIKFENGKYTYELAINSENYKISEGNYSIEGYDIFEKNGSEYVLLEEKNIEETLILEVESEIKKTLVAKAYVKNDEGEKVYSDYSNDLVIMTYSAPVLSNPYAETNQEYVGFENGIYTYDLAINSKDYEIREGEYTVEGYDVFEKLGTEYVFLDDGDVDGAAVIEVEAGTKKTLVAKVYVKNSKGEKIYSDYSNDLVIDKTTYEAPVLSNPYAETNQEYVGFENGIYTYDLAINSKDYEIREGEYTVEGYDVFEKLGTEYVFLDDGDVDGAATIEIETGTKKTLVAKVYVKNSKGEKIYSDYSNELVIDKTN